MLVLSLPESSAELEFGESEGPLTGMEAADLLSGGGSSPMACFSTWRVKECRTI